MIRPAGMPIAFGVQPDMTEHGWPEDAWPALWKKVGAAEILIIGTPIWLGEESSVCRLIIERLYAMSAILNDKGQSSFYGKVGGAGIDNVFTQRNTTIMTWNHLHVARMLKEAGGLPNHGNDGEVWKADCRFGYENPEHRA